MLPTRKLMETVFWDGKGVLMVELFLRWTTVMSEVYCKKLKTLCKTIQKKGVEWSSMTYGCSLLGHFNYKLFDHPPYSPDPAQSNYHLFTYLKNSLRSQCLNNNEELMERVKTWLSSGGRLLWHRNTKTYFPI
jgi:hypothetical protein